MSIVLNQIPIFVSKSALRVLYNNDYEDDKKDLPLLMTMIPKINKGGGCATITLALFVVK